MDSDVLGVTSVNDKLFVLLKRDSSQIAVYSINDYQLLDPINVDGYKPAEIARDITSCVRHRCLYIPDHVKSCIRTYDLASNAANGWSVAGKPVSVSVTLSFNLLVMCREPNKLVELRADSGQSVREITLQPEIEYPWHSVQLTTEQLVVCHGNCYEGINGLNRVCVVDGDGKVTCSYGGKWGSDVGQLNWPCHLAVDEDSQCIFVADNNNARVVLLSPTLKFVRYVTKRLSSGLYFHQATRRLFVGLGDNRNVSVMQLL